MNSKRILLTAIILLLVLTSAVFASGGNDSPMWQNNSGFYGHGRGMGMHGGGSGMGPGWGNRSSSVVPEGDRLQMEEVKGLLESEISRNGESNWGILEVMEFESNFYAQIGEDDERLIMEVLIDPYSGYVQPEYGPNMMWNTETSHHGRRRKWGSRSGSDKLTISEGEAVVIAGEWLERQDSNWTADDHADQFPGYYTLHTLENGQITGMLSVNGWDGQVWYHDWHGKYLGMEESHGDEDDHS